MIWRKIEKRLEAFYKANGRYALLVDGARQVGKTYSIEEFGRTYYDSVVKIDFAPIYMMMFLKSDNLPDQMIYEV